MTYCVRVLLVRPFQSDASTVQLLFSIRHRVALESEARLQMIACKQSLAHQQKQLHAKEIIAMFATPINLSKCLTNDKQNRF